MKRVDSKKKKNAKEGKFNLSILEFCAPNTKPFLSQEAEKFAREKKEIEQHESSGSNHAFLEKNS